MEMEDEDFLSQVAAAEADAISNKRRKMTMNVSSAKTQEEEGAYTAALKGSRSSLWQQQQTAASDAFRGRVKVVAGSNQSEGNDSCFKCGKSGHWARDCDAAIGAGSDPLLPEKACPCGLGSCSVLTANTEKNRGRKFYKCPVREENGGCGFFEWCDNSSGTNNMTGGSQNYASNSSFPDLPCPCGAGSCIILTAKTGKNIGQQFYRCPANQGSSCGFFTWCNDHNVAAGPAVNASKVYNPYDTGNKSYGVNTHNVAAGVAANASKVYNTYDTSNKSNGVKSGSSCFKCGKEGHWAKDCSMTSSGSPADLGGRSASSGTCYKCGKPGHWARDCSLSKK